MYIIFKTDKSKFWTYHLSCIIDWNIPDVLYPKNFGSYERRIIREVVSNFENETNF